MEDANKTEDAYPTAAHDATLPQEKLIRSAGRCPSGPRPEDLMLGHEDANPHASQRVVNTSTDDQALNMDPMTLTKLDIYTILVNNARLHGRNNRPTDLNIYERTLIVLNALYPNGIPNNISYQNKTLQEDISKFINKCEKLYTECKRNLKHFCKKNEQWLAKNFSIETPISKIEKSPILQMDSTLPSETSYLPQEHLRPQGPSSISIEEPKPGTSFDILSSYENLSDRQKRRVRKSLEESLEDEPHAKIVKVISNIVTDETGEKLCKSSAQDFEFVLKECLKTPTRSKKIATTIKTKTETKPYTPDEALSFIIERKLTVDDYCTMQKDLKERGFPAYPPYYKVQTARKMCYPEEVLKVTDREASVSFDSLLLHTFRRIVKSCSERISEFCRQKQTDLVYCTFEGSWGFDGSTGQSFYKQKFLDGSDDSENCLFATTYIPLQLKTNDGFVLWSNPSPQSFRFCRPLKIQYRAETKELILEEKMRVENEINNLSPLYADTLAGHSVISDPKLHLTIIDGKAYNIITGTTSQLRCACCGATATEFNKLHVVSNKPVNVEALQHGLSPLHAWIRFFEFLLHLGYKNDPAVMKWRVAKNSPEATIVKDRKKKIQSEIRAKMSLLVDVVRPNSGTTNDGNTARTALSDQHRRTFANILGIEQWLVDDLHTILVALSSGLFIDAEKFDEFCKSVAAKYVQKYNWFYMSVTVHKILIHGRQVIECSTLPIGMLSEQAGESRNKFWRYDREHHTRKLDRKTTITDLFHRALESSDPYLSSLTLSTRHKHKKTLPIPDKVLRLLRVTTENVHYHHYPSEGIEAAEITLATDEIILQSDNEENE